MVGVVRGRGDGNYEFDFYWFFSYRTYWMCELYRKVFSMQTKTDKTSHNESPVHVLPVELQLLLINALWYQLELLLPPAFKHISYYKEIIKYSRVVKKETNVDLEKAWFLGKFYC